MISFSCPFCGARFETGDELAGAKVRCANCECDFNVPAVPAKSPTIPSGPATWDSGSAQSPSGPQSSASKLDLTAALAEFSSPSGSPPPLPTSTQPPPLPAPTTGRLSPRQRRLVADYQLMMERFSTFPLIHLERTKGNPPEEYVVAYHIRGIERLRGEEVVYRDYHEVEIKLPGTYPRTPPTCRMLTPVFHPNIEPAIICIGDHWTASERLCDLVVRIGEMIAYQAHNIKSPLDGEAAMWTDLNQDILPIDSRDLTPPEN